MSTKCLICVPVKDYYLCAYCHYDGYPSHTGRILQDYIKFYEDAVKIVSFGDIVGLKIKENSFSKNADSVSILHYNHEATEQIRFNMSKSSMVKKIMLYHPVISYMYIWDNEHNTWETYSLNNLIF